MFLVESHKPVKDTHYYDNIFFQMYHYHNAISLTIIVCTADSNKNSYIVVYFV